MSTEQQRQAWRELDAARTPGEWEARQHNVIGFGAETVLYVEKDGDLVADCGPADLPIAAADAAFIAASSTAVPAMLADVDRLNRELEETRFVRNDRFVDRGEYTAIKVERDALAAELATVREAANVAWQQEHTERVRLEERLKAAEQRAQALELELDCID